LDPAYCMRGRLNEAGNGMNLPRRRFLQLVALPAMSRIATALGGYPTRPVRLLVGFAAGGPADTIARLTAQSLSERLAQQVNVENRVGGASNIAAEAVVRSAPDGYTLLYLTVSNAVNATLYDNLRFDIIHDIVPITSLTRSPGVLEVGMQHIARCAACPRGGRAWDQAHLRIGQSDRSRLAAAGRYEARSVDPQPV
jgi:hypothetical protein